MRDLKGRRVYLSGPMTGLPDHNREAFYRAKRACEAAGAEIVFNPREAWGHTDKPGEWYMLHDLHRLTESTGEGPLFDTIVLLSGWTRSQGAQEEYRVAVACGIEPVELREVFA